MWTIWVRCGPDHPLRFEPEAGTGGLKPYLHVRRDLWAKVTRPLFFDLVELGEEREVDGPGACSASPPWAHSSPWRRPSR